MNVQKEILFLTNIPSPYRVDFFEELGKYCKLTVIFEAKTNPSLRFNWNMDSISSFTPIFLSDGSIHPRRINRKIFQYLTKKKYDIIVATNYAELTELAAILYMRWHKIPYWMEVDGGIIRNENVWKRRLKTFVISGAKKYLSTSVDTDDYFVHYGAKREDVYRYPFTSVKENEVLPDRLTERQKDDIRSELRITEKYVVLGVGRFIYGKGYDVLLNAACELGDDIGIYIVGGQPTEEYLEMKEKHELRHVYFEGFKTRGELKEYYKAADIFVHPTREDIWGLVVNEAMAQGLPVITTDKCVGGVEMIENGKNGYIIPAEDSEILASKIKEILQNEDKRNRMVENNLEKIQLYTIEHMAKRHMEIMEEVMEGDHRKEL